MFLRTDLATELSERNKNISGKVIERKKNKGEVEVSIIEIKDQKAASQLGKPEGKYITISFPNLENLVDFENIEKEIRSALEELLPQPREKILVVGLGNREITADSIGPKTVCGILATRHISGQFAEKLGLFGLKSVALMAPDVLGKTGIEVAELCQGAIEKIKPDAVIAIDALAAGSAHRLFTTVQLCDTGISPGSGVKNSRKQLSRETLSVPVIAIGVPTVVDIKTFAYSLTNSPTRSGVDMVVTPKDADLLSEKISSILSRSLNLFLQPEIDEQVIFSLV